MARHPLEPSVGPPEKLCPHTRRPAMQPSHWAPEPLGARSIFAENQTQPLLWFNADTMQTPHSMPGARQEQYIDLQCPQGSPGPSANHCSAGSQTQGRCCPASEPAPHTWEHWAQAGRTLGIAERAREGAGPWAGERAGGMELGRSCPTPTGCCLPAYLLRPPPSPGSEWRLGVGGLEGTVTVRRTAR